MVILHVTFLVLKIQCPIECHQSQRDFNHWKVKQQCPRKAGYQNIDKEPYFNGKDVCSIVGYANFHRTIQNHVEDEDRKHLAELSPGSTVNFHEGEVVYIITETGVYELTFLKKTQPLMDLHVVLC